MRHAPPDVLREILLDTPVNAIDGVIDCTSWLIESGVTGALVQWFLTVASPVYCVFVKKKAR